MLQRHSNVNFVLGLRRAVVDFVGASPDDVDLVIDPFTPGSTETVAVSFNASCCVREATLKLLDFVGNASPKEFDLGPLYGTCLQFWTVRLNLGIFQIRRSLGCDTMQ